MSKVMLGLEQISEDLYQVEHRITRLMDRTPGYSDEPLDPVAGFLLIKGIRDIHAKVDDLIVQKVETAGYNGGNHDKK